MGVRSVVTVLVPAANHNLIDLRTAREELGIAAGDTKFDHWLVAAIAQVSDDIVRYCKRVFPVETLSETIFFDQGPFPFQTSSGSRELQLARWPLQNATVAAFNPLTPILFDLGQQAGISVTQTLDNSDAQVLTVGTDFLAEPERGWLIRLNSITGATRYWETWPVTVVYQAGYSDLPGSLVGAALRLVTARFRMRGRDPSLKEQDQPGLGRQTYWVGSIPGVRGAFPEEIRDILDDFRVPTAA